MRRSRFRCRGAIFSIFTVIWALGAYLLYANWQDKERQLLDADGAVLSVIYRASVEMYAVATETLFAGVIRRPEVLDVFARGVASEGAAQDAARDRLYHLLLPVYAQINERGVRQIQFHTAQGISFLRFNDPTKFGDPLFDLRPAVRIANTEKRAVSGFELGRVTSAYRYVFPIFRGGQHLGSAESGIPFSSIREAMQRIDPQREYAFVLRRDRLDESLFKDRRALHDTASIHTDFLVEDPGRELADPPPPAAATVRALDARLEPDPRVRAGMSAGRAFSLVVTDRQVDWAVSFEPIRDILDREVGYVIAYARAPLIAVLRPEFFIGLFFVTLALGLFAWFALRLARSRADLSHETQQLQTVTDTLADGLYVSDPWGVIMRVNPGFTQLLGFRAEEAIGRIGHELFHSCDAGMPLAQCPIYVAVRSGAGYAGEVQFRRKDGSLLSVEVASRLILEDGRSAGAVTVFRDITARQAATERIRQLAWYDALTGLPNRALLQDRLAQAMACAARNREQLAILFIDLDQFKTINDSLGHSVGDRLLQQVAARLTDCARASDTVSRLGGDEFVIVMPRIRAPADAAFLAEKVLAAIVRPYDVDGRELHVTASIGIAIYPDDGADGETLIKNADAAMYLAKESGRNNYQYFTEALNASAVSRMSLENALRGALERHEFVLHYQPQVDLSSGALVGVEALIRWQHPEWGLVPPDRFIPVAEDCGLIVPIGVWVLQEACRQNKAWQAAGLPLITMAVNVSAVQFHQGDLAEIVGDILAECGLDAGCLEIELTESALMKGVHSAAEALQQFKNMGVRLAIDDFGTGHSSLGYLRRFPIDKLKIDRSFVSDVTTDPDDAAIVSAIIAMGHRLRLKVVAEGVETPEQLAFLRQEGCDEAQGYHYSKPLPADDVERLMREWPA